MDIDNLTDLFAAKFKTAFYNAGAKDKAKFTRFFTHFYRYWYYSALISNTILSPANIIGAIKGKNENDSTIPLANLKYTELSLIDVDFTELDYSLENHCAVNDLETFVNFLSPDANLTANGFFPAALEKKIYGAMSIKDTYYIEYLFLLSANLGLIKRLPSINANKVQASSAAGPFFNRPHRQILKDMAEQTIDLCVIFIKNVNPYSELPITREFIKRILKNPVSMDEIYKSIFTAARENLDFVTSHADLAEKSEGAPNPDELEKIFTASTILLGSLFDKYLFLPFGYYLRLIQPLYIYPYDFKDTLKALNVKSPEDLLPALFVPCGAFSLTNTGMDLFGVNFPPGQNHAISPETPDSLLIELALNRAGSKKPASEIVNEISKYHENFLKPVYELKVSYINDKSFWKRIVVAGEYTLHSLHNFICEEFNVEPSPSYMISAGSPQNPFARFYPPDGKSKIKLTTETALDDLGLAEGEELSYTVNEVLDPFYIWDLNFNDISMKIEIMKIKKPTGIDYYPQVLKESQAFKDLNYMYDFGPDFDF